MKNRKSKQALSGFLLILGVVMVLVAGQGVSAATLLFDDDFNYTGVPDVTKWDGPWGDVASVNGEYGFFGNTTYSQKGGMINPVESVTLFEFRRPDPADGNVTVRLYDVWSWSGVGVLEITPYNVQIDALQDTISIVIAQIPISLDTWYSVAVRGNADDTTEVRIYERDSGTLVDGVSFWHDSCGSWNYHFAAAGTSDLDDVMIFGGSMSWDEIDSIRIYGTDIQFIEGKVFVSTTTVDVEEGVAGGAYDVKLLVEPNDLASVTIDLAWDASQITVSPAQLVFDPNGGLHPWYEVQTVSVEPVNDEIDEGDHSVTITHSVTSDDSGYAGVSDFYVQVDIVDDDHMAVIIEESDGSTDVTEGGSSSEDDYTVKLLTEPTGTVQFTISFDDTQVRVNSQVSPVQLTFDAGDYGTPKTVEVGAFDDGLSEGPHTSTITHSTSGGGYDGVACSDVVVNITDNEAWCGQPGTVYLDGDIDQNCYVDLLDFAIIASNWMKCTDPFNPECE